jgi:hypothetical protein
MKRAAFATFLSAAFLSAGLLLPAISHGQHAGDAIELDEAKPMALAEVLVLHATNDGNGIDPAIGDLPQLKQPPFSAYDSYKLLERGKLDLGPSGEMKLPDGGKLTLELEQASNDDKGKARYLVAAQVLKKSGDKFVSAEFKTREGVYFFLAGPPYEKGILVLGIRLAPKLK